MASTHCLRSAPSANMVSCLGHVIHDKLHQRAPVFLPSRFFEHIQSFYHQRYAHTARPDSTLSCKFIVYLICFLHFHVLSSLRRCSALTSEIGVQHHGRHGLDERDKRRVKNGREPGEAAQNAKRAQEKAVACCGAVETQCAVRQFLEQEMLFRLSPPF